MKTTIFELTKDNSGIGTLTFNTPDSRANILTQAALEEFESHLDTLKQDSSVKMLFIESAKEDIFIAGADIVR